MRSTFVVLHIGLIKFLFKVVFLIQINLLRVSKLYIKEIKKVVIIELITLFNDINIVATFKSRFYGGPRTEGQKANLYG